MRLQSDMGDGERGTDNIDLGVILCRPYARVLVSHDGGREKRYWWSGVLLDLLG